MEKKPCDPNHHLRRFSGRDFGGRLQFIPSKTVAEGKAAASSGGIVAIHTDSYNELHTINQDIKLVTWGGDTQIH